jgi:hypothetical protein
MESCLGVARRVMCYGIAFCPILSHRVRSNHVVLHLVQNIAAGLHAGLLSWAVSSGASTVRQVESCLILSCRGMSGPIAALTLLRVSALASCRVAARHVLSSPVLSSQVLTSRVLSYRVAHTLRRVLQPRESCRVAACRIEYCPIESCRIPSCPIPSCRVAHTLCRMLLQPRRQIHLLPLTLNHAKPAPHAALDRPPIAQTNELPSLA